MHSILVRKRLQHSIDRRVIDVLPPPPLWATVGFADYDLHDAADSVHLLGVLRREVAAGKAITIERAKQPKP